MNEGKKMYDYYCTHCGKKLSQDTVLFDMQYLLTRDDTRQFNILKFRMTLAELKALIASGTEGEHGYKKCKLTMAEIMGYIGNGVNLNDANIAALTLEEINDYMNAGIISDGGQQMQMSEYDDYDDDYADWYEEEDLSAEAGASYVKPASITRLENKSMWLVDAIFIRDLLVKDLSVLQGLFGESDTYEIQIREENDTDNDGKPVLEGYSLKSVGGALRVEARVCCECGAKVFEHAGTAKHQAVAFIGPPKAGKTSTILALTHYATHYMDNGSGGKEVWDGCQTIDSVASVQLLDKTQRKEEDLINYGKGIAPVKTKSAKREYAFCVTLGLDNIAQGKRRHLITLLEIPTELCVECVEDGKVQWAKVQNLFPVALTCDAFVLCFDTQSLADKNSNQSPAELVADVCNWADEFQAMRAQHNGLDTYVPTMVLFTKCEELEDPNAPVPALRAMLPLDKMYLLKKEKQLIAGNRMYKYVSDRFSEYGRLNLAYHAMMRCSPFGYNAPHKYLIENLRREGKEAVVKTPMPKNIDYLMRWLLSVSGCIPTEASFKVGDQDVPYMLRDFCITRPQLRKQNPLKGQEIEEAMARCALFENPGYFDREFVAKHNKGKFVLGPLRFESRTHPNGNAR